MSKTVHPYSHRLVTLRNWRSRWFARGEKYRELLRMNVLLRDFLEKKLRGHYVADITFEHGASTGKVCIHTSRPGMIIGRNGEGIEKLKKSVHRFARSNDITLPVKFEIEIVEIKSPDTNAMIVAQSIAEALEKRMQFRRVMKMTIEKIMSSQGVKGARIVLAGRLGGAEIARREELKRGSIPMQFIRGDIDFASYRSRLPYGTIGIKVWIYHGDSLQNSQS